MALTLTVPSNSPTNTIVGRLTSTGRLSGVASGGFSLRRGDTNAQIQSSISVGSQQRDGSDYYWDITATNPTNYRGAVYLRVSAALAYDFDNRALVPPSALDSNRFIFSSSTPLPDAPSNFTAVVAVRSVTLSWDTAMGSTYEVRRDGGTWSDATSPHQITGLSPETDYTFEVRVKASGGTPASDASSIRVTTDPIPAGPLSIENIDEQMIPVLTKDYVLRITIGGRPQRAYADGDMEGFHQNWIPDEGILEIRAAQVTRLLKGAIWGIHLVRGSETLDGEIIYNVVPVAPVIEDPGAQVLYKNIPFQLVNKVANVPAVMRGSGLLTGLKYVPGADDAGGSQIMTEGMLPADANLSESSFMAHQYAENEGGNDTLDIPVAIKEPAFLGVLQGPYSQIRRQASFRVYDLKDSNRQFGDIVMLGYWRFDYIEMSGRRLAVGGQRTRVYDYISGGQLGEEILRGGNYLKMYDRYLVFGGSRYFDVYDIDNEYEQLGERVSAGPNRFSDYFNYVDMSGTYVATFDRGGVAGGRIRVYDVANGNQQVGSDIVLSSSGRAIYRGIAISGSLVAAVRSDQSPTDIEDRHRLVKVFDLANGGPASRW